MNRPPRLHSPGLGSVRSAALGCLSAGVCPRRDPKRLSAHPLSVREGWGPSHEPDTTGSQITSVAHKNKSRFTIKRQRRRKNLQHWRRDRCNTEMLLFPVSDRPLARYQDNKRPHTAESKDTFYYEGDDRKRISRSFLASYHKVCLC